MQIDPSPAVLAEATESTESGDKTAKSTGAGAGGKKYTPPVDGQTGDLILEATTYLRLLIALLSLDAGNNDQVSSPLRTSTWSRTSHRADTEDGEIPGRDYRDSGKGESKDNGPSRRQGLLLPRALVRTSRSATGIATVSQIASLQWFGND